MDVDRWNNISNSSDSENNNTDDIPIIKKWNEKGVDTEYYLSSVLLPYNVTETKVPFN